MIDQLIANIKKTNAPIVVGLDPMMKFIPEQIQKAAFAEYGETLKGRKRLMKTVDHKICAIHIRTLREIRIKAKMRPMRFVYD